MMRVCQRLFVLFLCLIPLPVTAFDGQADLAQATQLKITAESLDELGEVINLCQRAIDKGLTGDEATFAKQLLASTLTQRGLAITEVIFAPERPDARWQQMRRLALADLERSLRAEAKQPQVHIALAKLQALPGGNVDHVMAALDEAVKLSVDDPDTRVEALMMRAGLRESVSDRIGDLDLAIEAKPTDPQPLRARGALHLAQENGAKALADFDAAIKLEPNHALTHEARGAALAILDRLEDSRAAYAKAIELEPKASSARMQRAQVALLEEKFAEAISDATKILEADDENHAVRLLRAQAYLRNDQPSEALADVNQVLKARPGVPPALRLRAQIHASQKKVDQAIADLREIVRRDPDDLETLFQIAVLYRGQKNFGRALALFDELLEKQPEAWFVRYGRADAYLSLGKHREALRDYDAALKQQPKDSGLLNNLAWLLATSPEASVRNGKRAIELATQACEITEFKAAHILSTLAAAYAESGDFATAKKWSQKALELCSPDLKSNLAKELASYEAGKPWRELLQEDQEVTQKSGTTKR
ncbi:MAG: tetratricopeptide repeat protein [Planctomycetaceae bacterium]|nr:tetratricopeptide repeat protein [Planctomycetaceae bacterium]